MAKIDSNIVKAHTFLESIDDPTMDGASRKWPLMVDLRRGHLRYCRVKCGVVLEETWTRTKKFIGQASAWKREKDGPQCNAKQSFQRSQEPCRDPARSEKHRHY